MKFTLRFRITELSKNFLSWPHTLLKHCFFLPLSSLFLPSPFSLSLSPSLSLSLYIYIYIYISSVEYTSMQNKRLRHASLLLIVKKVSLIIIYMYLSNFYASSRMWQKVNFKVNYCWFQFRVFFILDRMPNQDLITQSLLLFTHSLRENRWIHVFPNELAWR